MGCDKEGNIKPYVSMEKKAAREGRSKQISKETIVMLGIKGGPTHSRLGWKYGRCEGRVSRGAKNR
eukprot:scaffold93021_cov31-Attheya_sp.AAC.1